MVKRGTSEIRKALAYTKDKWDFTNNVPKESGISVEDIIDCIRECM
jgi:hypothetical protein